MSGPQEPTKSIYRRLSASQRIAPFPRRMNTGSPPTAPNARTGELTPPTRTFWARLKSAAETPLNPDSISFSARHKRAGAHAGMASGNRPPVRRCRTIPRNSNHLKTAPRTAELCHGHPVEGCGKWLPARRTIGFGFFNPSGMSALAFHHSSTHSNTTPPRALPSPLPAK